MAGKSFWAVTTCAWRPTRSSLLRQLNWSSTPARAGRTTPSGYTNWQRRVATRDWCGPATGHRQNSRSSSSPSAPSRTSSARSGRRSPVWDATPSWRSTSECSTASGGTPSRSLTCRRPEDNAAKQANEQPTPSPGGGLFLFRSISLHCPLAKP